MASKSVFLSFIVLILCFVQSLDVVGSKKTTKHDLIIKVTDIKDFKKLLRTRTNILCVFIKNNNAVKGQLLDIFADVANEVKGIGTVALVNCEDAKKMCKKLKVSPIEMEIKHYKDGEYNMDYDRRHTVKSMVAFVRNPSSDMPWDEDATAGDVVHVETTKGFTSLLKKKKPTLVMFYAPWCGYCKQLKPQFSEAATELKSEFVLAGVDCDKPELSGLRGEYNVTGYPTTYYFENGVVKYKYSGQNNKDGIVSWMRNPSPPKEEVAEAEWSDEESHVHHLTNATFQQTIEENPSVFVMFYAPWCGHCKKMKPDYTEAAQQMIDEGITGVLAAVDATKERDLAAKYEVKGYPKVIYFKDGEVAFDANQRTKDTIVSFMRDPDAYEPPVPETPWDQQETLVVHLTQETFKSTLKKKKHGLVMFYAPWCGHCKAAKPEFNTAAEKFDYDNKVVFAAMDCTQHQAECSSQDVSGYPTFKYFNYGKDGQLYVGKRMSQDFVDFMHDPFGAPPEQKELADPALDWEGFKGAEEVVHLGDDTFDDFITDNDAVLVMFYAPWCGHCKRMKPAYAETALKLKTDGVPGVLASFDGTVHRAVTTQFGVTGYPTIKFFKGGKFKMDYERERTAKELYNFVQTPPIVETDDVKWSTIPSNVIHLNEHTFTSWLAAKQHAMVMLYVPWCPHCKAAMPEFDMAADAMITRKEYYYAAIECLVTGSICDDQDVENYPTYYYYSYGKKISQYTGDRNNHGFMTFFMAPKAISEGIKIYDVAQTRQETVKPLPDSRDEL